MEKLKNIAAVAIVIIFLPYVITVLVNGKNDSREESIISGDQLIQAEKDGITEELDINEYILGMLASQMDIDYESEALAAQAVIIRTTLYYEAGEDGPDNYVFTHNYLSYYELETLWGRTEFNTYYEKLKKAVTGTNGQVLEYEGKLIDPPYHAVSNGITRKGEEAFGTEGYEYLESVECSSDLESENYLNIKVFSPKEIVEACTSIDKNISLEEENLVSQLLINETDGAGYVKKLKAGTIEIPGEEFRLVMGLSSSCFSLQEYNGNIRITTKGIGHGVGMSQYAANEQAKEGKRYEEILQYFYNEIKIENY